MKQQVLKNNGTGKNVGTDAVKVKPIHYVDSVEETQGEIRAAYRAYSEAQKDLLYAFKEQQQQGKNAYRHTERQYQFYEEIIEKAFKNRERAEQKATEIYLNTVKKSSEAYRDAVGLALADCKRTTDQAWNFAMRASQQRQTGWTYRCRELTSKLLMKLKSLPYPVVVLKVVSYFKTGVKVVKDGFIALCRGIKVLLRNTKNFITTKAERISRSTD
jgi:hypothetical protein